MRATFVGGPCGGHSHTIADDDTPPTRAPGCEPVPGAASASGHYARIASANAQVATRPSKVTDTIFYRWIAADGGVG